MILLFGGIKQKFRIHTELSNRRIIGLLQFLTGIFLIPFIVADLNYVYNYTDVCLNQFSLNLTLRGWLFTDAYIKIAVYVATWFFSSIASQLNNGKMLLICESTLLRFYYYFLTGWMVTGAIMYWGNIYQETPCETNLNAYLWSLLIISFVEIVLNVFVLSCIRGRRDEDEDETIIVSHRETEMLQRK